MSSPVWYPAAAPAPSQAELVPPSTPLSASISRADSSPSAPATKHDKRGVVSSIMHRERHSSALKSAVIGVRAAAAVLCLIAFSVMAADKEKGWAVDSYDRYKEYRYVVAVNVIGFVYAGFQVVVEVLSMVNGKRVIEGMTGFYFDFAMDQILAYLLISASSSASARTEDWVMNYGSDPFPSMANGSVAMSFLAFIAFAVSSLFSAYNLFTSNF